MSGYIDCGCLDCFEIAIGNPGELCNECEEAGCEADSECKRPEAYGCEWCDEEDALFSDDIVLDSKK